MMTDEWALLEVERNGVKPNVTPKQLSRLQHEGFVLYAGWPKPARWNLTDKGREIVEAQKGVKRNTRKDDEAEAMQKRAREYAKEDEDQYEWLRERFENE